MRHSVADDDVGKTPLVLCRYQLAEQKTMVDDVAPVISDQVVPLLVLTCRTLGWVHWQLLRKWLHVAFTVWSAGEL
jgi:hypothetical protein